MHIINLVVKSILRQFDVPKSKANDALDDASKALLDIAEDIEYEEAETQASGGDDELVDNVEGWIDKRDLIDEEEQQALGTSVMPVRLVLTKVRLM